MTIVVHSYGSCQLKWIVTQRPLSCYILLVFDKMNMLKYNRSRLFRISGAHASRRSPLRQFSPLLVAMIGLPGRGKSLLAKRLSKYLNYTGDETKSRYFILFKIIKETTICKVWFFLIKGLPYFEIVRDYKNVLLQLSYRVFIKFMNRIPECTVFKLQCIWDNWQKSRICHDENRFP